VVGCVWLLYVCLFCSVFCVLCVY